MLFCLGLVGVATSNRELVARAQPRGRNITQNLHHPDESSRRASDSNPSSPAALSFPTKSICLCDSA